VRRLLLVLALGGCFGGRLDGNMRPAVLNRLDALPDDSDEKRDAILDQAGQTAGPEQRKGQTKTGRKVETGAAWLAAIVGQAFSKSENVTLGGAVSFDENTVFTDTPPHKSKPAAKAPEEADATTLVPWVKLDKPPGE
jgi:hypothetical protein